MKCRGISRIETLNGPGGIGVGQPDERFTCASGAAAQLLYVTSRFSVFSCTLAGRRSEATIHMAKRYGD